MENDVISFQARFNGVPHSLLIPVANVIAIYARENGQGMAFEPEQGEDAGLMEVADDDLPETAEPLDDTAEGPRGEPSGKPRGGHLKVVK